MTQKIRISQCIGEWLRECFYKCQEDVFKYAKEIRIDITNGWHPPMKREERVIGWYGRLQDWVLTELRASVGKEY